MISYIIDDKLQNTDKVREILPCLNAIYVNKFSEDSAKKFIDDFHKCEDNPNQNIIPIYIDSYGGSVDCLLAMVDLIKTSEKKVVTACIGKAMSCGALLLAYGNERYAAPSTRIMLHDVLSAVNGKSPDITADSKEIERLNNYLLSELDKNTQHEQGFFNEYYRSKDRTDVFLTPNEALEIGLITKIGFPKFRIKLDCEINFN